MDTRAGDVRVAYPLFQRGSGGANPTSALDLIVYQIPKEKFVELNKLWHSRLPVCTNCWEGIAYGAFYCELLFAVAWWSKPVNIQLNDSVTYELRRMAIGPDAPPNTASRFLAIMVRLLRRKNPEIRRLISYQDTEVHTGTIYKASGWTAVTKSKFSTWTRDGPTNKRPRNPDQSTSDKIRWELRL
jgi:hypothetical protein